VLGSSKLRAFLVKGGDLGFFSNKQEYVSHSKQRERGWPGKGQSHFYLSHHLGKRT